MPSHHISRLRQQHHPRRRVGDIQLVSEHVRRQLGSSSYRTLSVPRNARVPLSATVAFIVIYYVRWQRRLKSTHT